MSEFKLPSSMVAGLLCAMFLPALPLQAQGFIDGAKSDLLIRNYYFDRDYLGESAQRAQREWAEGFVLNWASGYTPGAVGFGLEAQGLLGLKLDSTASRSASGLLHYDPVTREPDGHYSKFNLTGKLKASKTELLVGSVVPFLPVVFSSPTRLFQHTFRGAYLQSRDVDRLSLHAGVLDRARLRDGVDYVPMRISSPNGRFDPAAESDRFRFIGGDYALTGNLTLKAYSAELDELYRQQYLGVVDERAVGRGRLKSDFRLFLSAEDGAGRAGPVDNTNAMLNVTWSHGVHSIGGGYMQLSGDTAMPYVAGTEPLVMVEELMSAEFINPDERTVQVRYDRSFGDVGLPGLKTTWRYARGTGFDLPAYAARDLTESEKHIEVAYTVQQGALAGLRLRVRNSWLRSDAPHVASQRDGDELRINIDYTLKLLP